MTLVAFYEFVFFFDPRTHSKKAILGDWQTKPTKVTIAAPIIIIINNNNAIKAMVVNYVSYKAIMRCVPYLFITMMTTPLFRDYSKEVSQVSFYSLLTCHLIRLEWPLLGWQDFSKSQNFIAPSTDSHSLVPKDSKKVKFVKIYWCLAMLLKPVGLWRKVIQGAIANDYL